ncbi:MAG TPA: hypothetical protein DEA08_01050 [Planctomycetes bacterium]|nr:hypothetical protein [Planctomycetota bacterium]
MKLFFDERDDRVCEERGDRRLYWLDDLGAEPLSHARPEDEGFVFAGGRPIADYQHLVGGLPGLRDRPSERQPLLRLDWTFDALANHGVTLTSPRTWRLPLDAPLPRDLTYPLFVRTAESSWKLGGDISRVKCERELVEEAEALRRGIRWDALILAREWLDLASAGESVYGPVPQEIRTWIVDQHPYAWSFHHSQVVPEPEGFPPTKADLEHLREQAGRIGKAFHSRLVVADFVRLEGGGWAFLEAGPGSCAGTGHEAVFKSVASRLMGAELPLEGDRIGGLL